MSDTNDLQLVSFYLGEHLFGIDIQMVREISTHLDITHVWRAPDFVRGLVNLRGQIITVLDLGMKLGFEPVVIGPDSCLVVLKTNAELKSLGSDMVSGDESACILIDKIGEAVVPQDTQMEVPPSNLGGVGAGYLRSVCKLDHQIMGIVDVKTVLQEPQAV